MPQLGLGLGIQKSNAPMTIYPKNVDGCVLSLIAKKANKGNTPTVLSTATPVWADQSKSRSTYAYSNLVANSDFSSGTGGWGGFGGANITSVGNVGTSTSTGASTYPDISRSLAYVNGTKYYMTVIARTTSLVCQSIVFLSDNGTIVKTQSNPVTNQWYTFSVVGTASGDVAIRVRHTYATALAGSGQAIEVKNIMTVNLTALGLDTLTTAQCDELFPFTAKTNTATTPITQCKYNALDWTQWVKNSGTITTNITGMELNGTTTTTLIVNLKNATKYSFLFNVVSNNITGSLKTYDYFTGADITLATSVTNGNTKNIFTTRNPITNQQLVLYTLGTLGQKIKLKDIRLFELPTGSQIETDFTNLTADQLNALYPMGVNEATSNARANDCLMINQAGTSSSGWLTEVNANSGKTVYFDKLDGSDDYGRFVNTSSLDITSGEFALCATFRVAVGAGAGYIICKNEASAITIQYAILYESLDKTININLNSGIRVSKVIQENVWYNAISYRNSVGLVTLYINKVSQATATYANDLVSRPNLRIGARPNNAGGTTHSALLKGDIATQSIYWLPTGTLDIQKVIKAEMNVSKDYTGVS